MLFRLKLLHGLFAVNVFVLAFCSVFPLSVFVLDFVCVFELASFLKLQYISIFLMEMFWAVVARLPLSATIVAA